MIISKISYRSFIFIAYKSDQVTDQSWWSEVTAPFVLLSKLKASLLVKADTGRDGAMAHKRNWDK